MLQNESRFGAFEKTRAEITLHAADPVLMATFYKL